MTKVLYKIIEDDYRCIVFELNAVDNELIRYCYKILVVESTTTNPIGYYEYSSYDEFLEDFKEIIRDKQVVYSELHAH